MDDSTLMTAGDARWCVEGLAMLDGAAAERSLSTKEGAMRDRLARVLATYHALAASQQEVARLTELVADKRGLVVDLTNALANRNRELAEAQKDGARLDWLEAEHNRIDPRARLSVKWKLSRESSDWVNATSPRESIDAAMLADEDRAFLRADFVSGLDPANFAEPTP